MRVPPALRALPSALLEQLANRGMLVAALLAGLSGFVLPQALKTFLPAGLPFPYTAIAATVFIDLAGLGVLLALLYRSGVGDTWTGVGAWLGSVLITGLAFAGVAFSGTHFESLRTFAVLWLLFAAQAAVAAALCGLLRIFFVSERVAVQAMLLVLGLAATAIFWSREPITLLARDGMRQDNSAADRLASGVMKLSPPVVLAGAWNQECDTARGVQRGNRFDLIRAPLTYEVWIGSYQAMPYPEILPTRQPAAPDELTSREFNPGLILALLVWGFPVLIFADVLAFNSKAHAA